MEETIKDNSALFKNKVLEAFKYLLSSSGYWWRLSVTAILLINTVIVMALFVITLDELNVAYTQVLRGFFLLIKGLVYVLIGSFVGQTLYKIHYGYSGNKYKKLGGEEA